MPTMAEAPTVQPTGGATDDDDSLWHWHCCLPTRALCGARVDPNAEAAADPDYEANCVVCRAMEDQPCEVTCHPYLRD